MTEISVCWNAASCSDIAAQSQVLRPSGYYWIRSSNGTAVQVYCDMDRVCGCNSTGGWTRVAYFNMTDPIPSSVQVHGPNTTAVQNRGGYVQGAVVLVVTQYSIQYFWYKLQPRVWESDRISVLLTKCIF